MQKEKKNQFDKEYKDVLQKIEKTAKDAEVIGNAVETRLNNDNVQDLIKTMRTVMPRALKNLNHVYSFLKKYENTSKIEKDIKDVI